MLIVELFLMSIKLIVRFGPFIKFKLNDYFKIVLIKSFYKNLDFSKIRAFTKNINLKAI